MARAKTRSRIRHHPHLRGLAVVILVLERLAGSLSVDLRRVVAQISQSDPKVVMQSIRDADREAEPK